MPPEVIECWLETEDGQRGSHIELEPSFESIALPKAKIRNQRDEKKWVEVRFYLNGERFGSSTRRVDPGATEVFNTTIEGESVRRFAEQQGVEPTVEFTTEAFFGPRSER